jgi:hypothetical protein
MPDPELSTETYTGVDMQVFTDFDPALDLVALGPTGKAPRQVIVLEGGVGSLLNVTTKHGSRSLPGAEILKMPVVCGVLTIAASTTVTKVLVIW